VWLQVGATTVDAIVRDSAGTMVACVVVTLSENPFQQQMQSRNCNFAFRHACTRHLAHIMSTASSFISPLDKKLLRACRKGRHEAALELLQSGAKPNCRDIVSRTPLYFACFRGDTELARKLLDMGALVNDADMVRTVALHSSSSGCSEKKTNARCLLQDGYTPLHWACAKKHRGCVDLLLQRGADVNARTSQVLLTCSAHTANVCATYSRSCASLATLLCTGRSARMQVTSPKCCWIVELTWDHVTM